MILFICNDGSVMGCLWFCAVLSVYPAGLPVCTEAGEIHSIGVHCAGDLVIDVRAKHQVDPESQPQVV